MRRADRPASAGRRRLLTGRWLALLLVLAASACRQNLGQSPSDDPAATSTTVISPAAATLPPPQLATGTSQSPVPQVTAAVPAPDTILAGPTAVPTMVPLIEQVTLGYSSQNLPIYGLRVGRGPLKMVVVGGETAGVELAGYFQHQPSSVPDDLSMWFIPSLNPDNPGRSTNARGIDLLLNADTILDGCPDNDWQSGGDPPIGGPYPFSEVESRLWRRFLADAWLVIWQGDRLQAGGCGQEQPSQQLAAVLASQTGMSATNEPLPSGHPIDYLAGRGTAAATMPLTDRSLEQTVVGIEAVLAQAGDIMSEGVAGQAPVQWLDSSSSGIWHFPAGSFAHPLALALAGRQLLMIDSGRVLQLDLDQPAVPRLLLAAGAVIDGVRVLEPLDLALDGEGLLVLDRAGDIYRYDLATAGWQVERYDRPVNTTSAHYYVALSNTSSSIRQLLETDYHLAILFPVAGSDFIWQLPERHQVDISGAGQWSYVLESEADVPIGRLSRYDSEAGWLDNRFQPQLGLRQPRQVEATARSVLVLDQAGRRLAAFDPEYGQLQATYRLTNGQAASAFALDPAGQQLLVAGPDILYWWNQPEQQATIPGSGQVAGVVTHRPEYLEELRGLRMPIGGSNLTSRDNQLPGAPRHYRLGIHEGLDVYWTTGTAVLATASGTVLRADWDYVNPTQEQFDYWWSVIQGLGYTSPEAQEFYRGRQVWLAHDDGLVSRYVHLSDIEAGIVEGVAVTAGQVIGYVGNSGSPVSLASETTDAHLHFELWLGDHYLGQYLRPIEIWEWLTVLLR